MKARSSTLAASALVLVVGCSFPSAPSAIEAQRPGPAASPAVAAAGPRYPSNEVVFAPEIPAALRPARAATAAAPRRGLIFSVGADPATGEEDLPPVPEPEGWIPADEAPADVIVFAEEPAVFEEEATDEGTYDEESETVVIEEIRYIEAVEYETRTIETGVPVLVINGYSSWGCGNYPVVRSSRRFDPCFTPRRGACWEPVDYDPCWSACKDPDWTSWNKVEEERDRRVGPVVTGKPEGAPHRDAPKAREEPVARQEPPAPAPVVRPPRTLRHEPAVVVIPPAPAPRREPIARTSREAFRTAGTDEPAPAPRTIPSVRRTAHAPAPPAPVVPAAEPEERPARSRVHRPEREPADEPRAEPVRQPHRVAEQPRPEPVREPARGHPGRGRDRDRTPEVQAPPPPPAPPPAPAPAPAPAPSHHGGGKRGR